MKKDIQYKTENGITYKRVIGERGNIKGWLQISTYKTPYVREY